MITREEAIDIARRECLRKGWDDTPPYSATSGRDFILWGRRTWFIVTNAEHKGDNAYIQIDADNGSVIGAAFSTEQAVRDRRGIWRW